MYNKSGPMAFEELEMELWTSVDRYFQKLTNPKIKLAISGIVFPTVSTLRPQLPITSFNLLTR